MKVKKEIEKALLQYKNDPSNLIAILHYLQSRKGFLPEDDLRYVSEKLKLPLPQVYHVATFFTAFSLKPLGKREIVVCTGTTCWLNGGKEILRIMKKELGIDENETTSDGKISLRTVNCFGACSVPPAVMVDGRLLTDVKKDFIIKMLKGRK